MQNWLSHAIRKTATERIHTDEEQQCNDKNPTNLGLKYWHVDKTLADYNHFHFHSSSIYHRLQWDERDSRTWYIGNDHNL